ncbi:MAG: hypothetical protein LCH41_07750 [Armatimonadetes bacterium]|nr:hypothetical protein [Armatimonadota bacterium]
MNTGIHCLSTISRYPYRVIFASLIAPILLGSSRTLSLDSLTITAPISSKSARAEISFGGKPLVVWTQSDTEIGYSVASEGSLILTGRRKGGITTTRIRRGPFPDSLSISTTWQVPPGLRVGTWMDSYQPQGPSKTLHTIQAEARYWTTPFQTHELEGIGAVTITPDPNLDVAGSYAMPTLSDWGFGFTTPESAPRSVTGSLTSSHLVWVTPSGGSGAVAQSADRVFRLGAEARRWRSYPQQLPAAAAARQTFVGNLVQLNEKGEPVTPGMQVGARWWSFGEPGKEIGGPFNQPDMAFRSEENLLRVAVIHKRLGILKQQPSWLRVAEMTVKSLLAASPPNGFAPLAAVGKEPLELASPTPADEAATAFHALAWVWHFPGDELNTELQPRIEGTLERAAGRSEQPWAAYALAARTLATPSATPTSQQYAAQILVKGVPPLTGVGDPWVLEAAYWLARANPAPMKASVESLVGQWSLQQNSLDASYPGGATLGFGALGGLGLMDNRTAHFGSSLARLAMLYQRPDWMDRAAFALRSLQGLSNLAGTALLKSEGLPMDEAFPSMGLTRAFLPDARVRFESSEGLATTALWEVILESGGLTVFEDGTGVGIDGLAFMGENRVVNSLWSNPLPFERSFQEPILDVRTGVKTDSNRALRIPAVTQIRLAETAAGVTATSEFGLTLEPGDAPLTGDFFLGARKIPGTQSSNGLSAALGKISGWAEVRFVGKIGSDSLASTTRRWFGVPNDLISVGPGGWERDGDLLLGGAPSLVHEKKAVLSTGDSGTGKVDPSLIGSIQSQSFLAPAGVLRFTINGRDTLLQILRADSREVVAEFEPDTKWTAVEFETALLDGAPIQIRLIDPSGEGWISLGDLTVLIPQGR